MTKVKGAKDHSIFVDCSGGRIGRMRTYQNNTAVLTIMMPMLVDMFLYFVILNQLKKIGHKAIHEEEHKQNRQNIKIHP